MCVATWSSAINCKYNMDKTACSQYSSIYLSCVSGQLKIVSKLCFGLYQHLPCQLSTVFSYLLSLSSVWCFAGTVAYSEFTSDLLFVESRSLLLLEMMLVRVVRVSENSRFAVHEK